MNDLLAISGDGELVRLLKHHLSGRQAVQVITWSGIHVLAFRNVYTFMCLFLVINLSTSDFDWYNKGTVTISIQ